ncbi:MAG: phoR [Frankiales bacterium]|nr:phoR [Frankiales bacterium]
MTPPATSAGTTEAPRSRFAPRDAWHHTPLRVKLVAIVVGLAALGLLLSSLAASAALKGYLQGRVDDQLRGLIGRPIPRDQPAPGDRDGFNTVFLQYADPLTGQLVQVVPSGFSAPRLPATVPNHPITVASTGNDHRAWRVIGVFDQRTGQPAVLGLSLGEVSRTTHRLLLLESGVGLVVLVLLAGAGYLVVQRSLRPLVEVERTAEAIAGGDLTQRVPASDPRTEVGSLSQSFNAMLGRIEQAFAERQASEQQARRSEERMRRFVGDASHELRTPLTSIRGFAELYRQGALASQEEVDRAMVRVEEEAARMGLLVEDLLMLARLDQQRPLEHGPVDLLELAGDAVQDAQAVDPSRSVTLEAVASGPAPLVQGDDQRLRQVFANLVSNALTHTPSTAPVTVRVSTGAAEATVEVIDRGPGIPVDDREKVFERFYRTDASRTRRSGGSGLGLSIVSALVTAHGGRIAVGETPGGGATFLVTLPLG